MTQHLLSGNAENVDWNDIAEAGRAYADNLLGEPAVSKIMHAMADEIERLRTIMYRIVDEDCTVAIQHGTFYADDEPLFSVPCTPPTQPTPGEGSTLNERT